MCWGFSRVCAGLSDDGPVSVEIGNPVSHLTQLYSHLANRGCYISGEGLHGESILLACFQPIYFLAKDF